MNKLIFSGLVMLLLMSSVVLAVVDGATDYSQLPDDIRPSEAELEQLRMLDQEGVDLNVTGQNRFAEVTGVNAGTPQAPKGALERVKSLFIQGDDSAKVVTQQQVEERFLGLFKVKHNVKFENGVRKAGLFDFLFKGDTQ